MSTVTGDPRVRVLGALIALFLVFAGLPAFGAVDPGSAESAFFDRINAERAAVGARPLSSHPDLVNAARYQADAVRDAGRLFHNPNLGSVTTGWSRLGENVAYGPTVDIVHAALMDSPGHRDNILNPEFTHMGIGVVVDGSTLWVAEVFMTTATQSFTPPFADDDGSPHEQAIIKLANAGVTLGCGTDMYCPTRVLTREQMASLLVRALGLPASASDSFSDDGASNHQADINAIAAAGITTGCGAGRFCPSSSLSRGEMATFLVRALNLPPATRDYFGDDAGSGHQDAINALAEAGITKGCSAGSFCPGKGLTRGQMASFLVRALGL